mmetsp:Transcript_33705/g.69615  ORF Transcript_33705/g.69615 Transcript_33705/m.69615 type:complete len:230 (+) Transcript_33705:886-1575(+)
MALVASAVKHVGDVLDVDLVEGRRVALVARQAPHLAEEGLDEMADGHAGGDGVGVDDEVGADALARERHVVLPVRDSDRALLPVAGGELVADLWNAHRPHLDLDEALSGLVVGSEQHLVDGAVLVVAEASGGVALGGLRRLVVLVLLRHQRRLADDDISVADVLPGVHEPVHVQLVVVHAAGGRAELLAEGPLERLHAQRLLTLRLVRVAAVEHGAEEAAVDGRLVHDQ